MVIYSYLYCAFLVGFFYCVSTEAQERLNLVFYE
jgi:hypothetical protein